jgi:ubiquinone/menaquinone biosynthesis C-methylase UbiE/aminoglycoside phosphotransferase (APT) family kinase protein
VSTAAGGPFTDPALVTGGLYASEDRLARRTSALHRARVSGQHAAKVIAGLAAAVVNQPGESTRIADVGCGRGTTTSMLTQRFPAAKVIAVDISPALLTCTRSRLPAQSGAGLACADFHRLPLADASCDVIVAAFCLYHSATPGRVISQIARCLRYGGTAILVTKSAGSYRELDHLVAASGLDPHALSRPGLYQAAHSGNLPALTADHLRVERVIHHSHRFTFENLAHAAEYLATSPKYQLPAQTAADPAALTAALRERLADRPVTATSTVTYLIASRRAGETATTPARHRKHYRDGARRERAEGNYRWLASLGGPMRLPRLLTADGRHLVFEHVPGRHAQPGDLAGLASHLGAAHASAHATELHRARLDQPFHTRSGHQIPGFPGPRLAAVARELGSGSVPCPALTAGQAARLLRDACDGPAAFYKDANPRNFLITPAGPVTVDFDELTLAPFGYDLAKLVVTLAMTHGPLTAQLITSAIDAYNTAASRHQPGTGILTWERLMSFAEIHHILTARFLGQAGYRHSWDTLRPDPASIRGVP